VLGPIFERYMFLSDQIYGNRWVARPVVIGIAILIAWALYRPLRETVVKLWHEFKDLGGRDLKLRGRAWFTIALIVFIIAALATSAGWPEIEQIVPRTACWAALVVALLNLFTELFGADLPAAAPGHGHAAPTDPPLPPAVAIPRAATFFGWLIGLVVLASLIGFVPAIGVFVFIYMGFGFREPLARSALYGAAMTVFCYAVFDRGLSVPWPQSVLGDLMPMLRDATGLL